MVSDISFPEDVIELAARAGGRAIAWGRAEGLIIIVMEDGRKLNFALPKAGEVETLRRILHMDVPVENNGGEVVRSTGTRNKKGKKDV